MLIIDKNSLMATSTDAAHLVRIWCRNVRYVALTTNSWLCVISCRWHRSGNYSFRRSPSTFCSPGSFEALCKYVSRRAEKTFFASGRSRASSLEKFAISLRSSRASEFLFADSDTERIAWVGNSSCLSSLALHEPIL